GRNMPNRYQFLDVFPVRNNEPFEAKFTTQDVRENVMIDVPGNAVDLRRVDHYGAGTGFDCSRKRGQHIFSHLSFGYPGGRAIASGKRKTVTHVMFQAGGDTVLRCYVRSFKSAHKSYAHYFCEIRIFPERFVEAWP